jgi:hypothetical protein
MSGVPKSAYELAMERLRKKDAEEGVESRPLTEQQKAAIAEVRSFYGAKIAEQEVLLQSKLRATLDPAEREAIEQELRRTRERFASERDRKIEGIRQGHDLKPWPTSVSPTCPL